MPGNLTIMDHRGPNITCSHTPPTHIRPKQAQDTLGASLIWSLSEGGRWTGLYELISSRPPKAILSRLEVLRSGCLGNNCFYMFFWVSRLSWEIFPSLQTCFGTASASGGFQASSAWYDVLKPVSPIINNATRTIGVLVHKVSNVCVYKHLYIYIYIYLYTQSSL